jgi:hypothetical protein
MLDVKQAVQKSADYLRGVEFSAPQELRVEEVELSDDEGCWVVTLGFRGDQLVVNADRSAGTLFTQPRPIAHPRYKREYRVFRIRSQDGELRGMKKRVESDW